MSLAALLSDFAEHLHSDQFRHSARHPDHPTAFQRWRKLPLPALVALMLTGMGGRGQVELIRSRGAGIIWSRDQVRHSYTISTLAVALCSTLRFIKCRYGPTDCSARHVKSGGDVGHGKSG